MQEMERQQNVKLKHVYIFYFAYLRAQFSLANNLFTRTRWCNFLSCSLENAQQEKRRALLPIYLLFEIISRIRRKQGTGESERACVYVCLSLLSISQGNKSIRKMSFFFPSVFPLGKTKSL